MREQLWEAATIAVVGVAVVMATLTILMLAIMLLTRLFPGKNGAIEMPKVMEGDEPTRESVAAIAVAMALAMEKKESDSSGRHTQPVDSGHQVSRWTSAGRERLMRSRRKPGQKWGRSSG